MSILRIEIKRIKVMKKDKAESKLKQFFNDHKELILVHVQGKLRHVTLIDYVTIEENTMESLRVAVMAGGFYKICYFTELYARKLIKDYVRNLLNHVN